ncbi:MAG: stage 0 sporulation family protein [Acutalibacteraceae bacterium]
MCKVLGVRFKEVGKIHYLIYKNEVCKCGDIVVAETKRGIECGKIVYIKDVENNQDFINPSEKILRKATAEDLKSLDKKKEEEKEAFRICHEKIKEHKLKMKLIEAEYMFDRSKIIFYFVAESRVDFRSLVKDLAYIFRLRIELRQVGIRDEAKMLGGLGPCGRMLCCDKFLNNFQSVSIKMAKDQGLSLNPTKLSGTCGRLMCCLKYEQDFYHEYIDKIPRPGEKVMTPDGPGSVISANIISNMARVLPDNAERSMETKKYDISQLERINPVEN